MAINNRDRVSKGFDVLAEGLLDFVDQIMTGVFGDVEWNERWAEKDATKTGPARKYSKSDSQVQLRAITEYGFQFKDELSRAEQGFASELREARNLWAHNEPFNSDDAARALDTMERLLRAAGAVDSAEDVRKLRADLQRTVFEDQTRKSVKRSVISLEPGAGLKPWREVIRPHDDVASGQFNASEFAADLHLVKTGEASSEYLDSVEFYSRTYLTEGLKDLLARAVRRISGDMNASPVVNLQTNFGGGKTHSMLALYHLFSGKPATVFPQDIQELVASNGAPKIEELSVNRVALVGTALKAGSPLVKEDGTQVNTIWGELAWQLGGRIGYDIIADADSTRTSPGDGLRLLLQQFSPALILIDEWVAYARQLVGKDDLSAGTFDTQFTFAQALTEMVQAVPGVMLVVSIPASDAVAGDENAQGSDIEIGGANGQIALDRLQNVVRRVADQWRPTSKEESFEIVRRRLFKAPDADGLTDIAAVARRFVTLYRENHGQFPRETEDPKYEARIRASYPIHPELFDRLYEDWSTLERFQRTRGVLNLMSAVVHELWASGDSSPMILSGSIPLDEVRVNQVLTQYLDDAWKPIIDADIDGDGSTSQSIDNSRVNLGQRHVTRRLARAIFMGAAPRLKSMRKGLEKQYLWLGVATPGDAIGNFGSALDLMSQRSTYFYEEQGHYWFDTQPSVTKTAKDYADRLREEPEVVWAEIVSRLQPERNTRGSFHGIHVAPESSGDIPDTENTRLIIVHPKYGYNKKNGDGAVALDFVQRAVETRGAGQRVHRNALIFLVGDKERLDGLESQTREYLAWRKVSTGHEALNLSGQQRKQAEDWVARTNQAVTDRIYDAYVWAIFPQQFDPTKPFALESVKTDAANVSLGERVSVKLEREGELITAYSPAVLGAELSGTLGLVWAAGDISLEVLWGYFTKHPYLPRLTTREVLDNAIRQMPGAVLVGAERFALADGKDEETGRYRGLVLPEDTAAIMQIKDSTLLVNWEIANIQREADIAAQVSEASPSSANDTTQLRSTSTTQDTSRVVSQPVVQSKTRFYGVMTVDSERYSRDFTNINREILDHLAGDGTSLEITVEIQARKPTGFSEAEIRTISENATTLKFNEASFEEM